MTTTRISDLPENITLQPSNSFMHGGIENTFEQGGPPTNYIPMNVHPNPYGISAQNPIMPMPQQQAVPNAQQVQQIQQLEQMKQQYNAEVRLSEKQMMELENMQHVRLAPRDIPLTTNYLHDEQVQANYIPKPKLTRNYLHEYEEDFESNQIKHEAKKHRESKVDEILTELQTPILIMILFFMFQMPIINTMIFKRFSFLSIYTLDGNFNFYGLLLKSIFFGSLYYFMHKITKFISEF